MTTKNLFRGRKLLTPTETAHFLGYSEDWLYRLRARGQGPKWVRLPSKRIRYLADDLTAWLLQGEQAA